MVFILSILKREYEPSRWLKMEGDILSKLSAVQNKTIEEYWINHKENKRQLRLRELELMHPEKEIDSNIGGGKSNKISDTTANIATILAEDERYQHLKKITSTIENLYKELDKDTKAIVDMRYWCEKEFYEWEDIADKLYMSRHKVLRKRNLLIDETAKRIGWV